MYTFKSKKPIVPSFLRGCLLAVILGLVICTPVAAAQVQEKALLVQKTSGERHYYLLASEPVITFSGNQCMIESSDFSSTYPMYEVEFAKFVDGAAGIKEVETSIVVDLSDQMYAKIHGLTPGAAVSLYSLSGVMLRHETADEDGSVSVGLENLSSGVYIITTKETTFKIYRK